MNNKLDKIFRHAIKQHHLPNDGPQWADLEKRMRGGSRKPYLAVFLSVMLLLSLSFLVLQRHKNTEQSASAKDKNVLTYHHETEAVGKQPDEKITGLAPTERTVVSNGLQGAGNKNNGIDDNTAGDDNKNNRKAVKDDNTAGEDKKNDTTGKTSVSYDTVQTARLNEKPEPEQNRMPAGKDSIVSGAGKNNTALNPAVRNMNKPSLLSIYINFDPSGIKSQNKYQQDSTVHKWYAGLKDKGQQMRNSIGLNIGLRFAPFKHWSFSTGFVREEHIEYVHYHFIRSEVPVLDTLGVIHGYISLDPSSSPKVDFDGINKYIYSGVPVTIQYGGLHLRRFSFAMNISGSFLKLNVVKGETINRTELFLEDINTDNSMQLKRIWQGGVGLSMSYQLSSRLQIHFAPDFKALLNPGNKLRSQSILNFGFGIEYKII
jgi:hypothetical protein